MENTWLTRLMVVYILMLGACLGSFINVVITRLPRGISVMRPRSHCPQCLNMIAWYDNLPLLSYLLLGRRCRHCQVLIPIRYWLMEVMMAGLTLALWVRYGQSYTFAVWLPLTAAFLAITFLDIDHWWVPDLITYPALAFAILTAWLPGRPGLSWSIAGLLPALLLLLVAWLFRQITGKDGLGLGDVKLLAVIGAAMGLHEAIALLFLASMQASVVGMLVIWTGGHRSPSEGSRAGEAALLAEDTWTPPPHAIPFGPFLTLSTFQVLLMPEVFAACHMHLVNWLAGLLHV